MKRIHHSHYLFQPFVFFLILLVISSLLVTAGCRKKEGPPAIEPVVVSTLIVSTGEVENVLRFTGDVRAGRDVRLLAQVGERIMSLNADKGDAVVEGQILATVESSLLSHMVAQAQSGVAAARSNLKNLEAEYRRAERLYAEEAISQQQYEARKTQLENATAALGQAEAMLGQSRRQYDNASIRAPFSGVISNRFIEKGDMVAPGTPIFSLVQTDTMRIMAQVSEREFTRIVPGQSARLALKSLPDQSFEGKVVKKTPILDPVSRLATIEVHFPNPEGLLVPGMFGELEIVIGQKSDVVLIPVSAILYRMRLEDKGVYEAEQLTREPYVFVVEGGKALSRDIKTGYQQKGAIEILTGLKPGDTLVVRGHHALTDRSPVEIASQLDDPNRGNAP